MSIERDTAAIAAIARMLWPSASESQIREFVGLTLQLQNRLTVPEIARELFAAIGEARGDGFKFPFLFSQDEEPVN